MMAFGRNPEGFFVERIAQRTPYRWPGKPGHFLLEVHMSGSGVEITNTDREAIRLHRLAAHKSREAVASAVNRSPRWVARVEKGGSAVLTAADLMRLARELGVTEDDLVAK
jgi:hypothetical protein